MARSGRKLTRKTKQEEQMRHPETRACSGPRNAIWALWGKRGGGIWRGTSTPSAPRPSSHASRTSANSAVKIFVGETQIASPRQPADKQPKPSPTPPQPPSLPANNPTAPAESAARALPQKPKSRRTARSFHRHTPDTPSSPPAPSLRRECIP